MKEAFEFSCCLRHAQIYDIHVQPNQLSVVDVFVKKKEQQYKSLWNFKERTTIQEFMILLVWTWNFKERTRTRDYETLKREQEQEIMKL